MVTGEMCYHSKDTVGECMKPAAVGTTMIHQRFQAVLDNAPTVSRPLSPPGKAAHVTSTTAEDGQRPYQHAHRHKASHRPAPVPVLHGRSSFRLTRFLPLHQSTSTPPAMVKAGLVQATDWLAAAGASAQDVSPVAFIATTSQTVPGWSPCT